MAYMQLINFPDKEDQRIDIVGKHPVDVLLSATIMVRGTEKEYGKPTTMYWDADLDCLVIYWPLHVDDPRFVSGMLAPALLIYL